MRQGVATGLERPRLPPRVIRSFSLPCSSRNLQLRYAFLFGPFESSFRLPLLTMPQQRSNVDGVRGKREQMALIRQVFFSRASRASTPSCIPRISHHSRLKSDFASTDSCRGRAAGGGGWSADHQPRGD